MHRRCFSLIFCGLLMTMLILSLGAFGGKLSRNIGNHPGEDLFPWPESQQLSLYPVEESYADYQKRVSEVSGMELPLRKPQEKAGENIIKLLENEIEECTNTDGILFRGGFFGLCKYLDRFTGLSLSASLLDGNQEPRPEIVEMPGDQLGQSLNLLDMNAAVAHISAFEKDLQNREIDFSLFFVPGKHASSVLHRDYSQEMEKAFLEGLARQNVKVLDAGAYLKEKGLSEEEIFFRTDHHWLPSSGILATGFLAESLNANSGFHMDSSLYNLDRYQVEQCPNLFLGSLGKKAGTAYAKPEALPIYYPLYESDLTVTINQTVLEGSIAETLFDYSALESKSLYDEIERYWFYGQGDQALIRSHNHLLQDGSSLMVLKTSFADCMVPYLAAGVEDLTVVDLRYFAGSLQALLDQVKPDAVVYVLGLASTIAGTTEGMQFDFR